MVADQAAGHGVVAGGDAGIRADPIERSAVIFTDQPAQRLAEGADHAAAHVGVADDDGAVAANQSAGAAGFTGTHLGVCADVAQAAVVIADQPPTRLLSPPLTLPPAEALAILPALFRPTNPPTLALSPPVTAFFA